MIRLTKFITAVLFIGLFSSPSYSQNHGAVDWEYQVNSIEIDTLSGDFMEITFIAIIDFGWRMYDIGPYESGPLPTKFSFVDSPHYELVDNIKMKTKPHEKYDEMYMMDIKYFENTALFSQIIRKKTSGSFEIDAFIECMLCNDIECTPLTDIIFKIKIF